MDINAPNEWQCSHCKATYSFQEFITLKSEWVDPNRVEYGKVSICRNCGKKFHKNKWQLKNIIWAFPNPLTFFLYPSIRVSTVHLELNHFGYWYETMVFADKKWCSIYEVLVNVQIRYKTEAEAVKGHNAILRKIMEKQYTFRENEDKVLELKLL
jgi:NAD-dependent SIR2 family protein deacetylase